MTRVDPSAKRRISAPSRSSPANVPLTDSSAAGWTVRGVSSVWARSAQAREIASGSVRHAAIARLTAAARSGANASGGGTSFQLLMMDLDGFKAVNDTHGHKAGDHSLPRTLDQDPGKLGRSKQQIIRPFEHQPGIGSGSGNRVEQSNSATQ